MMQLRRIGIFSGGRKKDAAQHELILTGQWLAKRGNNIVVFALKKSPAYKFAKEKDLTVIPLVEKRRDYDFEVALNFSRVLKKNKVKTLLFRNYRETSLLAISKYLRKGKVRLVFLQDRLISDMKLDLLHTFRFNQIDAWVSPLNALVNGVKAETNLDHKKLHTIPFPIRLKSLVKDTCSKKSAANSLKIRKGQFVIGVNLSGYESLGNEIKTILQAVTMINEGERPIVLCSGFDEGSKPSKILNKEIKLLSKALGVNDQVVCMSINEDDPRPYQICDLIFLLPANEPFHGIATRALGTGVPCIAANSVIMAEILNNGEYGLLYNPSNPLELQKIIFEAIKDPALLEPFRDVVSGAVQNEMRKKQFCQNLEELIDSLPKRSRQR